MVLFELIEVTLDLLIAGALFDGDRHNDYGIVYGIDYGSTFSI
jgi:hypothetical protein